VYEKRGSTVGGQGSGSARWLLEIGSKSEKDTIYTEQTKEYIANKGLSCFNAPKRTGF
jgi:hypothetical protein